MPQQRKVIVISCTPVEEQKSRIIVNPDWAAVFQKKKKKQITKLNCKRNFFSTEIVVVVTQSRGFYENMQ